MGRMRLGLALGVVALGCSTRSEPTTSSAAGPLARVRQLPIIGERLRPANALLPGMSGLVPDREGSVHVTAPRTARGALRIARDEARYLEVVAEHETDAPGQIDGGAVLYANASPAVDAFVVVESDRAEEIRVLRTPAASPTARWRVRLSPALAALTVRDNIVEALDAKGRAWLRSEPIFAVDARGVTRVPSISVVPDGVAYRLEATLDTRGLEYPIALDPGWSATGAMSVPRMRHSSVKLSDGRVLAVGGQFELTSTGVLSSAEIYDPSSGTWTTTGSMKIPRSWFGLVMRGDGKVMALGGLTTGSCTETQTTEVYDPATGTWSDGPTVPKKWYLGQAFPISANRVVLIGGRACVNTGDKTASILDAAAGTWTSTTSLMQAERVYFGASVLGNGKILITGGKINAAANINITADLFDPATNTLSAAPSMSVQRVHHAQVTLSDGKAMVIAGSSEDSFLTSTTYYNTSEIFDPATSSWTVITTPTAFKHVKAAATVLSTGKVLIGPGDRGYPNLAHFESELFDPVARVWSSAGTTAISRGSYQIEALAGGSAIMFGGDQHNTSGARTLTATTELLADGVVAGGKCGSGGQCASGFCAEGVCCNEACTGKCQTCTATGSVGTCTSLTAPPAGKGTCDPYVCGAVDCKAACTGDADCIATSYCNTTTSRCEPRIDKGATCTTGSQCKSGFCADGYCCDSACTGACESCSESGSLGVCTKLNGVADKHAKCPTGECTTTCVAGACGFKAAATPCGGGASSCTGNTLTAAGKCSGTDERCVMGGTAACPGDLKCADASTCLSKCSKDADCVSGTCDLVSGACGTTTDAGVDAAPGTDVGVADGSTKLSEQPKVGGEFTRCSKASDCPSGHCVEGICCDTACTDKCYSCALITSPGKCTVSPIGVDLRNDCGPALQCLGTCDGTGQCIGAGAGTMCSRNRCTSQGGGVGPAYCPAPGAKCDLASAVPFDCAPYVCEPAFGACRTGCASSLDCVNGFVCDLPNKTCVAAAAPAQDDGGCAMGSRGSGTAGAFVALLAALGAVRRRRLFR